MEKITLDSRIYFDQGNLAVCLAVENLKRDMSRVLCPGEDQMMRGGVNGTPIRLVNAELPPEMWELELKKGEFLLKAGSPLGFVYGIYEISRSFLGIQPFWFWNDQAFETKPFAEIPDGFYKRSEPFRVKLRGWFVNDEVLLHTWKVNRDPAEPWRMVFEALLRLGGNMVIPGTDRNAHRYRKLASDMGLAITHHHAEPLGAEMFARAYPALNASFAEHSDKFYTLWEKAVKEQKDMNVVWNLGFRGQGDCPFWESDPRYDTDEARGELMSRLIRIQYEMVKKENPQALCCTNLYGETMELYKKGYLQLPEDVIHIWADNGFGKMVSRRQGNHNPRISALPEKNSEKKHGIYYHASFYDLQAAAQLTMLPNSPEFVEKELKQVLEQGADDYWLINCSNVKPHVFILDEIAQLWKTGTLSEDWAKGYAARYFGEKGAAEIAARYLEFSGCAVKYGPNEDDRAGEQFANHVPRILMTQFIQDKNSCAQAFLWAFRADTLKEQVRWYEALCRQAVRSYGRYLEACKKTALGLSGRARRLFEDSLLLQADILHGCYEGALEICKSLLCGFGGDNLGGFYHAGKAAESYRNTDGRMRAREHGKWHGFYENECQADIKQSSWVAQTLMGYFRVLGDGPHFYQWQREFSDTEENKRVVLILNMENHLTHEELYERMKERWEENETDGK